MIPNSPFSILHSQFLICLAKVSLVSLGCPKNLVDSEGALGDIVRAGHELVTDSAQADVVVVNTCGFIESARRESVDAVLEAVELKRLGRCRAVVVIGCLSQRFTGDLVKAEPGIDAILGISHAGRLAGAIEAALKGASVSDVTAPGREWTEHETRIVSTPPWTAYLKISDGCDNRCAYCAIPDIRGPYRSRPESLIVDEAKRLVGDGVKELILVGQDLTQYGADWGRPDSLPPLVEKLGALDGVRWIRLMYCYPTRVTRRLIDVMASSERVVKYMDLPLQHGDDAVLRAMNRRGTSDDYLKLIDELRSAMPDIALRSSFIVGFPGENEAAFGNLLAFVERIGFDRVGVFAYSREEGTPASRMRGRVSRKEAERRRDVLMSAQQAISLAGNRALIGRGLDVLIEGETEGGVFGRSYRDAPEVDGVVYVRGARTAPGELIEVKIVDADDYDLVGKLES